MSDFTYPASTYTAWAAFNTLARDLGQHVLLSGRPAIITDTGLVALNFGRVAMIRSQENHDD